MNDPVTSRPKIISDRSRLSRKILFRYFLALFSLTAFFIVLVLGAAIFTSSFIWQPYDPIYQFLHWFKENLTPICIFVVLVIWVAVSYYFLTKPLRYLDDIIRESEKLAAPGSEPIVLPEDLKNVQDDLNQLREQAFRNAMLAKEAEQRKNDLIVYLAHDLKTPLTSVIGYLTLLNDEPQISRELRAKYTGIALRKAERLEELVNEFFEITRFNLTNISLDIEPTNLSRMLEQTASEFEPILAEKRLSWEFSVPSDLQIFCDRDKLERVFDNLIRNAIYYSYPETKITLAAFCCDNNVRIHIQNHGKTIPPEKLAHLFDQFFRVDASRSSSNGGAGLGLAISKEIVELHGGKIWAQSKAESISFFLDLPRNLQKIV